MNGTELFLMEVITAEAVSALFCFILVYFMLAPFRLTRETRYLGLPLGFSFLGVSYMLTAFSHLPLIDFSDKWWIQLFFRAFSFLFLTITYLFSESTKKRSKLWTKTISLIIIIFIALILISLISPQILGSDYNNAQAYVRVFNLICIVYIVSHILKSHIEQPNDLKTLVFPFGYILLGIGQLLQIIWSVDNTFLAFWMGIAFRLVGLIIFLGISYRIFHSKESER